MTAPSRCRLTACTLFAAALALSACSDDDSPSSPPLIADAGRDASVDDDVQTSTDPIAPGDETDDPVADATDDTTDSVDDGPAMTDDEGGPGELDEVVADFDEPAGFVDGQSTLADVEPTFADGIATFDIPFTGADEQFGWNFDVGPGDYSNHFLVARIRLVSGFNASSSTPGGVQLRAWSDDWANFKGSWASVDGTTQAGQWIEYSMDLDEPADGFDPTLLNAVGIAFMTSTEAGATFSPAVFEVDWIGFVAKSDDGMTDDMATDDMATDDETLTDEILDAGVLPNDSLPEGMVVITNFDAVDGFVDDYENAFPDVTPSVANSIGTFELPFSSGDQKYAWNFDVPEGDYTAHTVMMRIRLVSGFNLLPEEAGGIQIQVWSDDWGSYYGNWTELDGTTRAGEWVIYTLHLAEASGSLDPSTLNGLGFAFHSGGDGSEAFEPAVFEVDWVGLMPGEDIDPVEPQDAGAEESDASVDEGDAATVELDAGMVEQGSAPPADALWFANFDQVDGFVDTSGNSFPDRTPTVAHSIATWEVPFTSGDQRYAWNFNTEGDFSNATLVARIRLVSGYNVLADEAGGVQLQSWSDNWADYHGNWTTLDGTTQAGEWVEYELDLDAGAPPFDPSNLNAVGFQFFTGGDGTEVFGTTTFEVDWVAIVPKPLDAGVPDAGVTEDASAGEVDSGAGEVDSGTGEVDSGTGEVDSGAGEVDSGGGTLSYFNIAGNGGGESGTAYWSASGGTTVQSAAYAHSGTYSILSQTRTAGYNASAYTLPAGQAEYDVSIYAFQASGGVATLTLTAKTVCGGTTGYNTLGSVNAASAVWEEISATLSVGNDCTEVSVYVEGGSVTLGDGGTGYTDIYVDDLSVIPTSVVNLAGNGGAESGTFGWQSFGATISQSSAFANTGTHSILAERTADWQGGSYRLPIAAGDYDLSVFVYHEHSAALDLYLSVKCTGGASEYLTLATVSVSPDTWTEMAETLSLPGDCVAAEVYVNQPGGAAAIPDIYMDDMVVLPVPQ